MAEIHDRMPFMPEPAGIKTWLNTSSSVGRTCGTCRLHMFVKVNLYRNKPLEREIINN